MGNKFYIVVAESEPYHDSLCNPCAYYLVIVKYRFFSLVLPFDIPLCIVLANVVKKCGKPYPIIIRVSCIAGVEVVVVYIESVVNVLVNPKSCQYLREKEL